MIASMHDFVVAKLLETPREYQSRSAYWRATATATQIPRKTIEKIARRQIIDPGVTGIELLAGHFGYTPRKAAALARSARRRPQLAAHA